MYTASVAPVAREKAASRSPSATRQRVATCVILSASSVKKSRSLRGTSGTVPRPSPLSRLAALLAVRRPPRGALALKVEGADVLVSVEIARGPSRLALPPLPNKRGLRRLAGAAADVALAQDEAAHQGLKEPNEQ